MPSVDENVIIDNTTRKSRCNGRPPIYLEDFEISIVNNNSINTKYLI